MPSVWRRSSMVEIDNHGDPAAGALAYFYAGSTTTPITVYQDAAESTPRAQPVTADANGRWPLTFIPFRTDYDEKVTDSEGTQLSYDQRIPNADPVEASEDTVDASELIATGDVIWRPVGGTRSGFVRANARTIGNAASGGTERANADTVDLFTFLWNGLANGQAAVSGGRGASAAADYAANKTITLPDLRFATIKGVADMGNTALTLSATVPFDHGNSTTAGSRLGEQSHTLVTSEMAAHTHAVGTYATASDGAHTHTGTTGNESVNHTHTFADTDSVNPTAAGQAALAVNAIQAATSIQDTGGGFDTYASANFQDMDNIAVSISGTTDIQSAPHTHSFTTASNGAHTHSLTGASASTGSDGAHNNEPPAVLGHFYMKL